MTVTDRPDGAQTSGTPHRIDPARSACVLIGVDDYTYLDSLRSVRHNLTALRAVLTDKEIWGLPEDRITVVTNPRAPSDLVGPIREAAERAEDTLIVYYAGHGLLDRQERQLHLTLPGSAEDQPDTCVRSADVRRAIRDRGSALRRVLILDCCFSGQVMAEMSSADRGVRGGEAAVGTLRGVEGSYVMTSAPRDRPSHAPDPRRCTVFTGALVDVMRQGLPDGPEMLGLHALFVAVRAHIAAMRPEMPQEPQDEDRNGVGGLDFIRNVAVLPSLTAHTGPPPVRRGRTVRWSLLSAAAGVALSLGAAPAVDWWHRAHPAPATGPCSPRAVLLDHSDGLDKEQVNYEPIEGLSALALTSEEPVTALAVADNNPGRLFPLHLGSPFDLELSAKTANTLRRADGSNFPDWYDAEALVVEEGGRTVLVGSETGPAIRRFDIATGKQVGKSLPVPKELRYAPEGSAQMGRGIESLTVSPDGRRLYAGWEAPLATDGDTRGRNILRIQRYTGAPGGAYVPDEQYTYLSGDGLYLAELAAVDDMRLLALERHYVAGLGNTVQVVEIPLENARDVTGEESLYRLPADVFAEREVLFDLADCPAGGPGVVRTTPSKQGNPLADNVEGMALGEEWTDGRYEGWRPLYLISDDNGSTAQITRVYSLAVRLSG
ncbi:caspase, EACC1-associated type [Streptomyces barkulensis]|uniref:caspase, EACC1-associated type n=1 Tax=Streptomyces barkulensis TaxID=1257026 RepID=UPI000C6CB391|nr:esterase-like activity of phytase family protein [Streptomyces barkulensis]